MSLSELQTVLGRDVDVVAEKGLRGRIRAWVFNEAVAL
jgi:predicted nucleotidyltransferase